jgi:hypothetical protein
MPTSTFGVLVSNFGHILARDGTLSFGYLPKAEDFKYYHGLRKRLHRVIWQAFYGPITEKETVDHINACRYDNRLVNFRILSGKQNAQAYHNLTSHHKTIMGLTNCFMKLRIRQKTDKTSTQKNNRTNDYIWSMILQDKYGFDEESFCTRIKGDTDSNTDFKIYEKNMDLAENEKLTNMIGLETKIEKMEKDEELRNEMKENGLIRSPKPFLPDPHITLEKILSK